MKNLLPMIVLLAAGAAGTAQAAEWKLDPAASRLDFNASFETTPSPGSFKDFDVRLGFDPDQPAGGHLDVGIQVASASMSSADIDKAIAGPEWFDFAGHPRAEFHSSDIRRVQPGGNRYVARGTLSLKGQQKPVEVPFTWTAAADGAGMDGEFTVKRAAFGIGTGEWVATDVIGPDVVVRFHARLKPVAAK
jgi:polyisoprenoid-binding protein YceI